MNEASEWITDLDQVEWWLNGTADAATEDDETVDGVSFDIVRATLRRTSDADGNVIVEECAVMPLVEVRELLRLAGYTFHAGTIGRWVAFDLEALDRDRTFVAEHGMDTYATFLEAGHDAQRDVL